MLRSERVAGHELSNLLSGRGRQDYFGADRLETRPGFQEPNADPVSNILPRAALSTWVERAKTANNFTK